jgi:hypothetical protein
MYESEVLHPDQVKVGYFPRASLFCNKTNLSEIPLIPKYSKEDRQMDGMDRLTKRSRRIQRRQTDKKEGDRKRAGEIGR